MYYVRISSNICPIVQLKLRQVLKSSDVENALATVSGQDMQKRMKKEHEKEQEKKQQKEQEKEKENARMEQRKQQNRRKGALAPSVQPCRLTYNNRHVSRTTVQLGHILAWLSNYNTNT